VALAASGPGSIDVIEIDAASHGGVDDARELRERAFYTPVSGRFKIYIIDEAHMVTQQGFNALLKLVEEPPSHLKFIFATTEPDKVIATIRSRTHHYPFRLVPPAVLRGLLEEILDREGVTYEPAVLPLVVRAGAGSVRDSLSVLDQLVAGSDESGLTYERAVSLLGYTDAGLLDEITDAFAAADGGSVFRVVDRVIEGGYEPRRFAADMLDRFRDLIVLSAVPDAGQTGLLDVSPDRLELMREQAGKFGQAELTRAAEIVSNGLDQMRGAIAPRLLLELMCAQVLLPGADSGEKALLARLERLERGLTTGGQQPAPGTIAPGAAPAGGNPEAAASGPSGPADPAPGPAVPPARPAAVPSSRPAAASLAPAPGAAPAGTESIRDSWDAILDAVKAERRVAWMLLSNATVVSLDQGLLTLSFARDGELKGFASSGHDAVLKRVLSTRFNLNVQVKPVSAADRGAGPGSAAGSSGYPGQPGNARDAGYGGDPAPVRDPGYEDDPGYGDGPGYEDDPGDASDVGRGEGSGPAGAPGAQGAARGHREARGPGQQGPAQQGSGQQGSGQQGSGQRGSGERGSGGQAAEVTDLIDMPDPGDAPLTPPGERLTGIDHIQRALGGRIIDDS
jgi:DNA polymerase-3 subunit gamma/tau